MYTVTFGLRISADEVLRYYRGEARAVVVRADSGLRLQLPASALRPFVTADGVSGRFAMQYGADGKLISLRRLAA